MIFKKERDKIFTIVKRFTKKNDLFGSSVFINQFENKICIKLNVGNYQTNRNAKSRAFKYFILQKTQDLTRPIKRNKSGRRTNRYFYIYLDYTQDYETQLNELTIEFNKYYNTYIYYH